MLLLLLLLLLLQPQPRPQLQPPLQPPLLPQLQPLLHPLLLPLQRSLPLTPLPRMLSLRCHPSRPLRLPPSVGPPPKGDHALPALKQTRCTAVPVDPNHQQQQQHQV